MTTDELSLSVGEPVRTVPDEAIVRHFSQSVLVVSGLSLEMKLAPHREHEPLVCSAISSCRISGDFA